MFNSNGIDYLVQLFKLPQNQLVCFAFISSVKINKTAFFLYFVRSRVSSYTSAAESVSFLSQLCVVSRKPLLHRNLKNFEVSVRQEVYFCSAARPCASVSIIHSEKRP